MSTKIEKSDFTFLFAGYGHYKVTYQSPKTGKKWTKTINDVPLIEMIKNNGSPKRKDLEILRRRVKA